MMFDLGIVSVERTTLHFACGCGYDGNAGYGEQGVFIYALVTCPQRHFSKMVDRQNYREHLATHKRRRRKCQWCNGAAAPAEAA